jgi:beta-phosphoglucomutase-like phosphatase (HAD superfamily)
MGDKNPSGCSDSYTKGDARRVVEVDRVLPLLRRQGQEPIRIQAFFWDLDGVLINTEPYKYLSYIQVLVKHGISLHAVQEADFLGYYKSNCVGKKRQANASAQLAYWKGKGFKLDLSWEEYAAERMKYYEPIKGNVPLLGHNVSFLSRIPGCCPTYLVSRTTEEEARRIIATDFRLARLQLAVAPSGKKYENAIKAAAQRVVSREACIAIEDTTDGVKEAKDEHLFTIAVPNEFTQGQDFSLADLVTNDLSENIAIP